VIDIKNGNLVLLCLRIVSAVLVLVSLWEVTTQSAFAAASSLMSKRRVVPSDSSNQSLHWNGEVPFQPTNEKKIMKREWVQQRDY